MMEFSIVNPSVSVYYVRIFRNLDKTVSIHNQKTKIEFVEITFTENARIYYYFFTRLYGYFENCKQIEFLEVFILENILRFWDTI